MVLVTGATGHIGNVLVRELLSRHAILRALVLPGDDTRSINTLPMEIVWGDVRDFASLLPAFKGIDIVYHLAEIVSIGSGNKKLLHEVNVEGTKNVLRACINEKIQRLYYVSSIHAVSCNSLTTYEKATAELGYKPRPLKQSIFDAVHWIKENQPA